MRRPGLFLLLVFLGNVFVALAQNTSTIPTEVPWHKSGFETIKFSYDGRHLVTLDRNNRLIITDLKVRMPFFSLEGVSRLIVSEKESFFYAINEAPAGVYVGGYVAQKRSLQNGQLISEFVIPYRFDENSLGHLEMFGLDETSGARLLVPYSSINGKIIYAFDEQGNRVQSYGPLKGERVAAMVASKSLFVLTPQGLYEVENETIRTRLTASTDGLFGNMKLRNDTLFVLSQQAFQVYDIRTWKKIKEIATPFFASEGGSMSTASVMKLGHDFGVDQHGNGWLVDTRLPGSFRVKGALREKRRYLMARLKDDIEYPLTKNQPALGLPFTDVDSEFALHAGKNMLAFSENTNEIIIQHLKSGELFRLNKKLIEFDGIYFTDTPGRILLRYDPYRKFHVGIFLDLTTGRHEPVYLLESRYYKEDAKNGYRMTGIHEKLYVPYESGYQTAEYVTQEKDSYLMFEMKDRSIQDTLILELATGTLKVDKETGRLQWRGPNRKLIRELVLKTPEGKPLTFREHPFERYSYDSANALLAISYRAESIHNPVQYIIELTSGKIKKTLTEKHAITLLNNSNYYVSDQGLFDFKTGQRISGFPDKYRPHMSAYDFRVKGDVLTMVYATWEKDIVSIDLRTGKYIVLGRHDDVERIFCDPRSDHVYTLSGEGYIKIWKSSQSGLSGTFTLTGNKDLERLEQLNPSYVMQLPDGNFMGTNRYFDILSLRKGTQQYSVQAMDRQFNRPDKVLKALGYADASFVEKLETILNKRPELSGTSGNDVSIKNKIALPYFAANGKVNLAIETLSTLTPTEGVMVYVNGSALWTKPKNANDVKDLVIDMVDPVNYIRTTVMDAQGSESPGDYVVVNSTPSTTRDLFVISIGVSQYAKPEYDLRYAAKDAKEINNNLRLTMSYENVKTLEFYDEKVDRTILTSIRAFLKQAKIQDQVMVYYAGHGLLDNQSEYFLSTHKIDFQKPSEMGISLTALLDVVAESPARKKIIMLDACNSGLVDDMQLPADEIGTDAAAGEVTFEHRGVDTEVSVKPNYSTLYFTISTAAADNGVSIIAAAGGNEAALEGGGLKNGLFTYSFIKAIESGDANVDEDSTITLNELQTFIADRVQSLSHGKQRPAYRQANIYYDAPIFKATDPIFSHFIEAVKANQINFVQQLLKDGKVEINKEDFLNLNALHYSAGRGYFKMTQLLLSNGATVDHNSNRQGVTASYWAADNGHDRVLHLLALNGADMTPLRRQPNLRNKNNPRLLKIIDNFDEVLAYEKRHEDFLKALYEDKSNAEALLKQGGIDINHKTYDGYSLLFQAIAAKNFDAAQWLVEHKADVNLATDDDNFTVLMLTVYMGNHDFLKYLLNKGADKTKKDFAGRTALDFAKQVKDVVAEDMLK
jgi:ankyrin repeat protein